MSRHYRFCEAKGCGVGFRSLDPEQPLCPRCRRHGEAARKFNKHGEPIPPPGEVAIAESADQSRHELALRLLAGRPL